MATEKVIKMPADITPTMWDHILVYLAMRARNRMLRARSRYNDIPNEDTKNKKRADKIWQQRRHQALVSAVRAAPAAARIYLPKLLEHVEAAVSQEVHGLAFAPPTALEEGKKDALGNFITTIRKCLHNKDLKKLLGDKFVLNLIQIKVYPEDEPEAKGHSVFATLYGKDYALAGKFPMIMDFTGKEETVLVCQTRRK